LKDGADLHFGEATAPAKHEVNRAIAVLVGFSERRLRRNRVSLKSEAGFNHFDDHR
jgi:hypothetical protein